MGDDTCWARGGRARCGGSDEVVVEAVEVEAVLVHCGEEELDALGGKRINNGFGLPVGPQSGRGDRELFPTLPLITTESERLLEPLFA